MKKILALLMALLMLVSFAACGDNGTEEETTTGVEETTEDTAVGGEIEDTTAEDVTDEPETEVVTDESGETVTDASGEAVTEEVTEKEEDTTKKPATSDPTKAPTQTSSKKPSTTAEIVEYFNKSVNKVKTSAKSIKHTNNDILIQKGSVFPSVINGVLKLLGGADKFIGDTLAKENAKFQATTYTGADIKAKFPVEGESYASKLTTADVASATCTESNGVYTIVIKTVADAKSETAKHGSGHAPKAFNVTLPGIVNENIPGVATSIVGTAAMSYPSCKATIKVNAATGNVISADYDTYWTINFDKVGVVIPFLTTQSFTVAW